jgi:D-alanyl-D-alanine carboxypeptidase
MAMTTSQLRSAWGPACSGTKVSLHEAYAHLDLIMKKWSYRPRAGVTGSYNCRRITGGSGYSLHAFGPGGIFVFWTGVRVTMALAVDICWDRNPYGRKLITDMPRGMIDEIKALRTNNGKQVWGWGGDYGGNKDAMHFEIVCAPVDIATGIRGGTAPPPPVADTTTDNGVNMLLYVYNPYNEAQIWCWDGMDKRWVQHPDEISVGKFVSALQGTKLINEGSMGPTKVTKACWDSIPVKANTPTPP